MKENSSWYSVLDQAGYRYFDILEDGLQEVSSARAVSNVQQDKLRCWYGEIFCTCKTDNEITELNNKMLSI